MKYLCLGFLNAKEFDLLPKEKVTEIMSGCGPHLEAFRGTGKILAEAGTEGAASARSIRRRNGKRVVTDGPFVETKEVLGSFFVVDAENIEEAVEIASLHPAVGMLEGEQYGFGIEVRPILGEPFERHID